MGRTKVRADQVDEDTLQDKDGDTKIEVEEQADGDEIVFTTAGQSRMIIDSTGQVGLGVESPSHKLDINGDIRIRGNDIRDNSGDTVIEMDGSGYLKFTKGIKYARGVLASSASSPAENGGWIKFASMSSPGTSNLDTAASSFLICFAGQDSTNNRQLDGLFLVHAKHTVNTAGAGTDGGAVTNAYYEPEGTFIVCEPLHSKVMSAAGVDPFDPLTDLLMILENDNGTPQVDLYIKCCAKQKRCFVTHLGGTGQENTPDTDIGFAINTGESWSTTEPTAPSGSVKLTGDYVDKIFNDTAMNNVQLYGDMLPGENNSSDLGSSTLRWAEGHFETLFHEDYLMAELSIPGLDIQADTNAWTFNCPYNMTFEQMDAYLDTVSGDLDITVTNLDDANNTIFSIADMTASPTSDTSATNADVDAGDRIRFAISNVTGSPQGLRVNIRFRRRA